MLSTKLTVIALAVAAGLTAAYPASSVDYMTAPENEFVEARASVVDALADKVATKLTGLLQVGQGACGGIAIGGSCNNVGGSCNGACASQTTCTTCCDGGTPNNGACGSAAPGGTGMPAAPAGSIPNWVDVMKNTMVMPGLLQAKDCSTVGTKICKNGDCTCGDANGCTQNGNTIVYGAKFGC